MLFQNILLPILFGVGANAWANYKNCKCHDSRTGLQNDAATEAACNKYADDAGRNFGGVGKVQYSADPHHQCSSAGADNNGIWINNGDFNTDCYRINENFYQVCWGKQP